MSSKDIVFEGVTDSEKGFYFHIYSGRDFAWEGPRPCCKVFLDKPGEHPYFVLGGEDYLNTLLLLKKAFNIKYRNQFVLDEIEKNDKKRAEEVKQSFARDDDYDLLGGFGEFNTENT